MTTKKMQNGGLTGAQKKTKGEELKRIGDAKKAKGEELKRIGDAKKAKGKAMAKAYTNKMLNNVATSSSGVNIGSYNTDDKIYKTGGMVKMQYGGTTITSKPKRKITQNMIVPKKGTTAPQPQKMVAKKGGIVKSKKK